ncbi:MAG: DUF11 domain-containing protein [Phycisphaerales bacterium]|nr:DUF11 domain-containing protein [Phycisphaerales bacterium]
MKSLLKNRLASRVLALGCAVVMTAMAACSTTTSESKNNESIPWHHYREGDGVVRRAAPEPGPAGDKWAEEKPAAQPVARTSSRWPTAHTGSNLKWTWMAFPTGEPTTSAVGLEKGMPAEVRLNQPFDCEIWVTNLTSMTLRDVRVTDSMGEGFKFNSSTPAGRPGEGGMMTWALGDMGPNEVKVIKINGTATREGVIGSCATVTYNTFLCAEVPVVSPRLALTKTGPAEVLRCDVIEYKFEVANTGTGALQNVVITDTLPAGLKTLDDKNVITFTVPSLAGGQKVPFTARVKADKAGRFENKATAKSDALTAESGVVATVVKQPVLTIDRACRERQFIGLPLESEITIKNTGDGVANNLVVEDMLPTNATFTSATDGGVLQGNKVVWNLGSLAPGATKKVTVRYGVPGAGTFAGTSMARADCATAVNDGCQTVVTGVPALLLETVDNPDPIQVGDQTTYTITVTNQGTAPDTNIKIVCVLEDTQAFVSAGGATNATTTGSRIEFAPIASLAPGAKAEFRVVVRAVKVGDTRFRTIMTSDQLTRPVEETESTNIYQLN